MSNQDKPNGNMTKIERQIWIDQIKNVWTEQVQLLDLQCQYRKEKYDRLVKAGFSEQQALEIIKSTNVFE